jgi:hypothetical protein
VRRFGNICDRIIAVHFGVIRDLIDDMETAGIPHYWKRNPAQRLGGGSLRATFLGMFTTGCFLRKNNIRVLSDLQKTVRNRVVASHN